MNLPSALRKYKETAKSRRSAVHRRMFSPKSALTKRFKKYPNGLGRALSEEGAKKCRSCRR